MDNEYLNNFENVISMMMYECFKVIDIILVILLILSLIILAIGCLIKSQKIKSKFLVIVPGILISNVIFLIIPYAVVVLKEMI